MKSCWAIYIVSNYTMEVVLNPSPGFQNSDCQITKGDVDERGN